MEEEAGEEQAEAISGAVMSCLEYYDQVFAIHAGKAVTTTNNRLGLTGNNLYSSSNTESHQPFSQWSLFNVNLLALPLLDNSMSHGVGWRPPKAITAMASLKIPIVSSAFC